MLVVGVLLMDGTLGNSSKLTDKTKIYFGWLKQKVLPATFFTFIRKCFRFEFYKTSQKLFNLSKKKVIVSYL